MCVRGGRAQADMFPIIDVWQTNKGGFPALRHKDNCLPIFVQDGLVAGWSVCGRTVFKHNGRMMKCKDKECSVWCTFKVNTKLLKSI